MKKPLLYLTLFFTIITQLNAANYYWIGGSGNWSDINHWATTSGGSSLHSFVPTPSDDVFFDAGSGFTAISKIVTVNTNATCKNMSWSGALNSPFISGTASFALNIYGTLLLQPTMIYGVSITNFMSTSIGNTITTNGVFIGGAFNFNGIGSWILQNALSLQGVNCNQGTFDSNNNNISTTYFKSTGSNNRTVTLGNSVITTNFSGASVDFTGTNLSLSASTSTFILSFNNGGVNNNNRFDPGTNQLFGTVIFNFSGAIFGGTGNTFRDVLFNRNGSITTSTAFNNLSFTSGYIYDFNTGSTYTITNSFNANPSNICSAWTSITLPYNQRGGTRANIVMPVSATVNISNCAIQNINATGGAVFTATNSVDDGNNSGWTFLTPSVNNLYWIGGAGNWSDGSHWATTSGGVPSGCIPGASTNVFFDINSGLSAGSETITVNTVQNCRNLTCSGSIVPPKIINPILYSGILNIYGSVVLQSGMTYNVKTEFKSSNSETIQCNTAQFNAPETDYSVFFIGSGSWTLSDDFSTQGDVLFGRGTLSTNNYSVNLGRFSSTTSFPATTRNLIFGSSVITVNAGNWTYNSGNLNAGTSHVIFNYNATNYMTTAGSSHTYYNVTFNYPGFIGSLAGTNFNEVVFKSNGDIQFGFKYNELHFSPNCTYNITGTQTITALFNSNTPSCGGWATISGGTLSMPPSATVNVNQAILQNATATGGAIFTASNSINVSGNTGWTFGAVTTNSLYWVGGSGNWNDATHWSTVNNGIYPSTNPCVPGPGDDVFFNANSGLLSSSRTVSITASVYCHDITCAGSSIAPQIIGTANLGYLNIYGSTVLQSGGTYQVGFVFKAPNAETITSNGAVYSSVGNLNLTGKITFDGAGSWTLTDDFNATGRFIHFIQGTINTNNHDLYCNVFGERTASVPAPTTTLTTRHLIMGSSSIFLSGLYNSFGIPWEYAMVNSSINSGTGHIIINNSNNAATQFRTNSTQTYYDVTFSGVGTYAITGSGSNFHNVIFLTNGEIQGSHIYNELTFTGRYTYRLENGFTQTVTSNFYPSGNPCFITFIRSTTNGTRGIINVQAGSVNYDYVDIQDIDATPSFTTFNIAGHSTNSGNNLNMVFAPTTTVALSGLGADITLCQNTLPITLNTVNFFPNPVTTFSWTGGVTTNSLSVTTGGNYSVAVRYASDCIVGDGIIVTANPNPTVAIGGNAVTCNGAATTLTASGASTYTWTSPTVTTNTLTVNPASNTTYSVVGTSTAGCVSQQSVITITVSASPTVAVSSVSSPTICSGNSTTITPSGASTYTLTSATQTLTTAPFVVNPTGTTTYTLRGTSSSNCPSTNSVQQVVIVNTTPTVAILSVSGTNICSGNSSTITPSGASTYTLTSSTQTLTSSPFVVSPNSTTSYTLTGTSASNCPSINNQLQFIFVNTTPTVAISMVSSPTICSGNTSTITPSGASTYTLVSGTQTLTTAPFVVNPTANTTYTLRGTSSSNCPSNNSVQQTITVNTTPTVAVSSVSSPTICSGNTSTITPSGASTYTLTSGTQTLTTAPFVVNPTANTTYTLNGTSSSNCPSNNSVQQTITVNTTPTVSVLSVSSPIICSGNTSTITPSGASTYTLVSGTQTLTTAPFVVNPTASTIYTLNGTSSSNCPSANGAQQAITVNTLPLLSVSSQTNVSCFGLSNGAVSLLPSGGLGSGYTITPAATSNLSFGTYTYTLVDGNSCSSSTVVSVTQPTASLTGVISGITANTSCTSANGTASVTLTGGTPSYTVNWDNGFTGDIILNLNTGMHTYTVTDANGCTDNAGLVTIQGVTGITTSAVSQTSVSCFGATTGALSYTTSGGATYTYTLTGTSISYTNTTGAFTNLISDTYTLVAMDDISGCIDSKITTISSPSTSLTLTGLTTTTALCNGGLGVVTVTVSGGTPSYNYVWSSSTSTVNSATYTAGSYSLTVTDLNNCSLGTQTFVIIEPTLLTVSVTNSTQSGCGLSNGGATLTVNGGTLPFVYSWSTPITTYTTNVPTTNSLSVGSNSVYVLDGNGCTSTSSVITIASYNAPVVTTTVTDVLCYGDATGSILTNVSGSNTYTYTWSNGSNSPNLLNVLAGSYSFSIIDENNCIVTNTISVGQPSLALSVTISSITNVACVGASNGYIEVFATGGTPSYNYVWQPGNITGNNIGNLSIGNYTLEASDNNGCVTNTMVSITSSGSGVLQAIVVSSENATCDKENGSILIDVTGGTPSYNYQWSPINSTSSNLTNIPSGNYTVIVTDFNGCMDTLSYKLECKVNLFIPEIFSPNGDGQNEKFEVKGITDYPNNTVNIFNRWGALVFSKKEYNNEWDGKANVGDATGSNMLPSGTYYVVIDFGDNGKTKTYTGYLQLEY